MPIHTQIEDCEDFTSYLETLRPSLQTALESSVNEELKHGSKFIGKLYLIHEWKSINLLSVVKPAALDIVGTIFFNKMLNEKEFASALRRYTRDIDISATMNPYVPSFAAPAMHSVLSRYSQAEDTLLQRLVLEIEKDPSHDSQRSEFIQKTIASAGSNIDSTTSAKIARHLLLTWLQASNQVANILVYAVLRCQYLGIVENLRYEMDRNTEQGLEAKQIDRFIQETAAEAETTEHAMKTETAREETDTPAFEKVVIQYSIKLLFIYLLRTVNISLPSQTSTDLGGHEGFDLPNKKILFRDINYHEDD